MLPKAYSPFSPCDWLTTRYILFSPRVIGCSGLTLQELKKEGFSGDKLKKELKELTIEGTGTGDKEGYTGKEEGYQGEDRLSYTVREPPLEPLPPLAQAHVDVASTTVAHPAEGDAEFLK
eukprot:1957532-Pyramimonas_sp.AAC.1